MQVLMLVQMLMLMIILYDAGPSPKHEPHSIALQMLRASLDLAGRHDLGGPGSSRGSGRRESAADELL